MSDALNIDQFFIQVDGTDLPPATMTLLSEAVVEEDLAQPKMFVLRFLDPELKLFDDTLFDLGKEITIGATDSRGRRKKLMTGEVTAIETECEQGSLSFVVQGYDKSHRLYRGCKIRTFLKQTDSAIASKIAQEAGLSADVQATTVQHEYVIQDNRTDMEFLRARAARIGYRVIVEDNKLRFRQAEQTPPEAPAQEFGASLLNFNARLSGAHQVNKVEVRGWDLQSKKAIVGTSSSATATNVLGYGKTAGAAAQAAFASQATLTITDQLVFTAAEATALAQAVLDDVAGDYISADGICLGEPTLHAGTLVEIKGIGKRFGGKYFVTATRHSYNYQDGYRTSFSVNGRRPHSLVPTLVEERPRHVVDGVVVGVVTNVNDPEHLGRVKLKFSWLDEQQESNWSWIASPGAGSGRGFFALPEVNDQVLVVFEQGDMNRPYVIGGLWSSKDKPPSTALANGKVMKRTLKTRAGHFIEFDEDESANKGSLTLSTASGNKVIISDTDKKIEIKSQNHTVTLDDQGRAVKITSGGTLEMTASGNTLKFTQTGIELTGSGGALKIAPAGVELAANANMTVKANANFDAQANAIMNIKSSAILNIQGTLVKIN